MEDRCLSILDDSVLFLDTNPTTALTDALSRLGCKFVDKTNVPPDVVRALLPGDTTRFARHAAKHPTATADECILEWLLQAVSVTTGRRTGSAHSFGASKSARRTRSNMLRLSFFSMSATPSSRVLNISLALTSVVLSSFRLCTARLAATLEWRLRSTRHLERSLIASSPTSNSVDGR